MRIVQHISGLRDQVRAWRERGESVGLVPTMGNLHGGHLSLVEAARERSARVVVSIFVNPTQFGPGEDLAAYPRTLERDCAWLEPLGVDVVFAPSLDELYPDGAEGLTVVEVPGLSGILCGATRPGHFAGVATVVAKLFHIVQPDLAVFGRKDYQQLLVIERMVRDLNLPLQVIGAPIVRDPDGLAMSSRNAYLEAEERRRAPRFQAILADVAQRLRHGERDYPALERQAHERLEAEGLRVDYVTVRRQADLGEALPIDRALIVLGAIYLGRARLIDNVEVTLPAV